MENKVKLDLVVREVLKEEKVKKGLKVKLEHMEKKE